MKLTAKTVRESFDNQVWLERAILAVYEDGKNPEPLPAKLGRRGFAPFDQARGSYYATWINKGNSLSGDHVDKARKLMERYAGVLIRIAEEKARTSN